MVESISPECCRTVFEIRDDLMGHYARGMLHGGVSRLSSMPQVAWQPLLVFRQRFTILPWRQDLRWQIG
jgi:hypothetical protein